MILFTIMSESACPVSRFIKYLEHELLEENQENKFPIKLLGKSNTEVFGSFI